MPASVWTFDLELHQAQIEVFQNPTRFQTLVCGRRFGKSHLQVSRLAYDALAFPQLMPGYDLKNQTMQPVILAGMPTLRQARKILWRPLVRLLENCPILKNIDRSNHIIELEDRPQIHLAGLNDSDGDRARGLKLWRACVDEIQDVRSSVLDTVILPALSDTPRSRGLFTGTPKGRQNHLYNLFQRENVLAGTWKSFNFPTESNPFISRDEIELARATLSQRLFEQEFLASFVNFEGQIFSEFDPGEHVVPIEQLPQSFDSFYVGHDPGDVHPAIVLIGLSQNNYYILEALQLGNGSDPVPTTTVYDRIEQLTQKYGSKTYRCYVDPSRPGVIQDLRTVGKQKDIAALKRTIAAYNKQAEGNAVVNNLFHQDRLLVSAACPQSYVDELLSYHRYKDPHSEQFLDKEDPNQVTHRIDSTRYILASLHNQGARSSSVAYSYGAAA